AAARAAGMPAVLVVLDTPAPVCRSRNAARDRAVPARVPTSQLASVQMVRGQVESEGWDLVHTVSEPDGPDQLDQLDQLDRSTPGNGRVPTVATDAGSQRSAGFRQEGSGLRGVVLQVSRFPEDGDLLDWLRG